MITILVPMAGRGSRFKECGLYSHPKPLIDVDGMPMISRVVENLKPTERKDVRFVFIVQREHYEKYDLQNVLNNAVGDFDMEIVQIDGITEGAACTALLAADFIDNGDELMIANADQLVTDGAIDKWFWLIEGKDTDVDMGKVDGLIMVFEANHPKWSYAKLDKDNFRVVEVAEKKVIGKWATVGIYWFRKGSDFVKATKEMIKKDIRTNNEFYVCPVYNEMILAEKLIVTLPIKADDMMGIGTPEDLNRYLINKK